MFLKSGLNQASSKRCVSCALFFFGKSKKITHFFFAEGNQPSFYLFHKKKLFEALVSTINKKFICLSVGIAPDNPPPLLFISPPQNRPQGKYLILSDTTDSLYTVKLFLEMIGNRISQVKTSPKPDRPNVLCKRKKNKISALKF